MYRQDREDPHGFGIVVGVLIALLVTKLMNKR
jgi:hypothetical protein